MQATSTAQHRSRSALAAARRATTPAPRGALHPSQLMPPPASGGGLRLGGAPRLAGGGAADAGDAALALVRAAAPGRRADKGTQFLAASLDSLSLHDSEDTHEVRLQKERDAPAVLGGAKAGAGPAALAGRAGAAPGPGRRGHGGARVQPNSHPAPKQPAAQHHAGGLALAALTCRPPCCRCTGPCTAPEGRGQAT